MCGVEHKMLQKNILILLALFIQCVEGFETVIVVAELDVTDYIYEDNVVERGSNSNFKDSCCFYGKCSCPSLYNTLANLTSNVLINVTTDVDLSSVVTITGKANIIITGHNNPTVNCKGTGGLHFISCYNCTIVGVTWEGCGAKRIGDNNIYPVLQFTNSSSITIQYCSFQQSIGQAVVLSGMSGDVNINHCNFLYNKQYEGHGTAIHYSSNDMLISSPLNLMITGCNFSENGRAKSIINFGYWSAKICEYLKLQNSKFHHNRGVPIYLSNHDLHINGSIEFFGNIAQNGGGIYISDYLNVIIHKSAAVNFTYNKATNNGGAIFLSNHSSILFDDHSTSYQCYNNELYDILDGQNLPNLVTFFNNEAYGLGQDIYADNSNIVVGNDYSVIFDGNNWYYNSSAIYIEHLSTVKFGGNCKTVCRNYVINDDGHGVMYVSDYSAVTFKENSTVTVYNNCVVNANGVAMYITFYSNITFQGNSTVTFSNNLAFGNGGAICIEYDSAITFEENSTVTFNDNIVPAPGNGGAVYFFFHSTITFKGNSKVRFCNNSAYSGGAMYVNDNSSVIFEGKSAVTFYNNSASSGGAITVGVSTIIFSEKSTVTFTNNKATNGGAIAVMYIYFNSVISFDGNSNVTFTKNIATVFGGAIHIVYSTIMFGGNSTVRFADSKANFNGGAMYIISGSSIRFQGNSTVTLNNNTAGSDGGAMYIYQYSTITFKERSLVTFSNNNVNDNNGGAVYSDDYSAVTFEGNSTVIFHNNTSDDNGGALFVNHDSYVTFKGNSTVTFYNNKADSNGGALYTDYNTTESYIENSTVTFNSNRAELGGSAFIQSSSISFEGNSFVSFTNNLALRDGGAIYCSDHSYFLHFNNANISFSFNTAKDYGGAIYVSFKESLINLNSSGINFKENTVGIIQNSVYINVLRSCDRSCLLRDINIDHTRNFQITTSPHKLLLYNPAICINGNDTDCDTYYMSNIMLGQGITFDACVHDYYNQPTEATQFVITGINHQYYNINGSKYITISCDHTTQGITVTGNLHSNNSYNYSMNISLYVARASESKIISVDLIVELSQCHPGFWYSSGSSKCECYHNDTENIISCSGSNSTIKRGYWFGSVNDKSTVTSCPNDYCNFTCCEITNGIYHLSPVRANQCKPHRSGTACGNCEEGYSLSFDSPNCVEVDKCTIEQTVLVITLSLLYWIAVVVAVFVMMYFKVTVGSLYAIIYYYSVVDILLSQVLFISNGLYTTVSIMSSLAKLTPQFLGQLCLVQNMSGIDQQFIHYVHPTVISLILIMIIMLARRSRRVSSFVSRGIIHFICFLLLLSYTSVASTSLLLMRPLKFMNVDKVYTYLSPDIKYFNGRHLMYVITAIIFMVAIVIVFPLLLLFEPYLNSKINFIKIKPLLDQFQGCYKDKYRCFAGYYMICRLVIILLVIVKISDDFINQYMLLSSCALMQLIHVLVQPYITTFHNVFDGIILQLIVIISGLPVIEFVDNYDKTFMLAITYVLVILPLTAFIAMKLWFNKKNILDALNSCRVKYFHKYRTPPTDDDEQPNETNEIRSIIVDDNMRRNATIVDV